jgi:hypothetical protein
VGKYGGGGGKGLARTGSDTRRVSLTTRTARGALLAGCCFGLTGATTWLDFVQKQYCAAELLSLAQPILGNGDFCLTVILWPASDDSAVARPVLHGSVSGAL